MEQTQDLNVTDTVPLVPPAVLRQELPVTEAANCTVIAGREAIKRILRQEDRRLLVIVGPCSIHDPEAALEYAGRLNELRLELQEHLCIVMRVYFEKPRTTVGWKGLIYDPHLDGSDDLPAGLRLARQLLLDINGMGLPAGTEMLDPITPQYLSELISWSAIGARTTESQTHREMASGLSMPVGFKNSTEGVLQVAIDAMEAARHPHTFLGVDAQGRTAVIRTRGNPWGHVVLRGGHRRPNYDPESIATACSQLRQADVSPVLMVDCSHANSRKQHEHQEEVWSTVVQQRLTGNTGLIGLMVESHLHAGNQKIPQDLGLLRYGISVTDACVDWETTDRMLRQAHAALAA
ncbi:Phospho-2-dehydro-3-deoxyheptonate aldolase, Tyr-sensitive [Candidatus Entotheonellaceae bacterium PAL068K]